MHRFNVWRYNRDAVSSPLLESPSAAVRPPARAGLARLSTAAAAAVQGVVALVWLFQVHLHPSKLAGPAVPADGSSLVLTLAPGVTMKLVRVHAGGFDMGSPESEADRDVSEGPRHHVTIARDFFLGEFELSQAQWVAVMNENQSQSRIDLQQAAECISWGDTQIFCDELSKRVGRRVRLPSEAEWEYACRAGTDTAFSTGETLEPTEANFNAGSAAGETPTGPVTERPIDVGSFKPNAFGIYDMHGNVSEWCADVFHDSYEGAPTDGSAWTSGGDNPDIHVYRGGAYNNDASSCRSSMRFAADSNTRVGTVGLRLAADVRGDSTAELAASAGARP